MSAQTLTEQFSLRLSAEHRTYLRGQAEAMKKGMPCMRIGESDVVRILIERAIQAEWEQHPSTGGEA